MCGVGFVIAVCSLSLCLCVSIYFTVCGGPGTMCTQTDYTKDDDNTQTEAEGFVIVIVLCDCFWCCWCRCCCCCCCRLHNHLLAKGRGHLVRLYLTWCAHVCQVHAKFSHASKTGRRPMTTRTTSTHTWSIIITTIKHIILLSLWCSAERKPCPIRTDRIHHTKRQHNWSNTHRREQKHVHSNKSAHCSLWCLPYVFTWDCCTDRLTVTRH